MTLGGDPNPNSNPHPKFSPNPHPGSCPNPGPNLDPNPYLMSTVWSAAAASTAAPAAAVVAAVAAAAPPTVDIASPFVSRRCALLALTLILALTLTLTLTLHPKQARRVARACALRCRAAARKMSDGQVTG